MTSKKSNFFNIHDFHSLILQNLIFRKSCLQLCWIAYIDNFWCSHLRFQFLHIGWTYHNKQVNDIHSKVDHIVKIEFRWGHIFKCLESLKSIMCVGQIKNKLNWKHLDQKIPWDQHWMPSIGCVRVKSITRPLPTIIAIVVLKEVEIYYY